MKPSRKKATKARVATEPSTPDRVSKRSKATVRPAEEPFWRTKKLNQLSRQEWESLCDGCGRCCLNKFEDPGTKEIHYTDVACRLLDTKSCRCSDYPNRTKQVPDCIVLSARNMRRMTCLPPTCGYRLVAENKDLYWWHPLRSGDPRTVHTAGISVRGRVVSESGLSEADMEDRLVSWPISSRGKRS